MTLFVPARWFTATNGRNIGLIVLHRMEAPDKPSTAEGTAQFFRTLPADRKASAHRCYDSDSRVDCVREQDVAYAAPGANNDGLHIELPGYSKDDDWGSPTMVATLDRVAVDLADDCERLRIPIRWRVAADLTAGGDHRRGITDHAEVTKAYPNLGNHWDPGPHFDPDAFIDRVLDAAGVHPPTDVDHFTYLPGDANMPDLSPSTVVGTISARLCGFANAPEEALFEQTSDGGVKAINGAPFYGSYPGLPDDARKGQRYFVGISANEDGTPGYTSWANDSTRGYSFGPGKNGH
jgi:hypothetical protein